MSSPPDTPPPVAQRAASRTSDARPAIDRGRLLWLLVGALALVGGTLLGWSGTLLEAVATPPALVRAALVGGSVVAALWCIVQAVRRIDASRPAPGAEVGARDLAALIRGVRYVFLAVAAVSAAAGWLLGHPLPLVVALVIAGVDILETTFLLMVVALRRGGVAASARAEIHPRPR